MGLLERSGPHCGRRRDGDGRVQPGVAPPGEPLAATVGRRGVPAAAVRPADLRPAAAAVRPAGTGVRAARPAPAYAEPAAPSPVDELTDQLQKLANLKNQGILTEEEFSAAKARLLNG